MDPLTISLVVFSFGAVVTLIKGAHYLGGAQEQVKSRDRRDQERDRNDAERDTLKDEIGRLKEENAQLRVEKVWSEKAIFDYKNQFDWAEKRSAAVDEDFAKAQAKLLEFEGKERGSAGALEDARDIRLLLNAGRVANSSTHAFVTSGSAAATSNLAIIANPGGVTEQIVFRAVTQDDVGKPTEPGTYDFRDGKISIGLREIQFWRENPDGQVHATAIASREFPESGERPLFKPSGWVPRNLRNIK